MDSHVFRLIALELAVFLRGGRVEKIFSPAPGLLALTIYNFGLKRIVILRHDKAWNPAQGKIAALKQDKEPPALYLTNQRLTNPEKPSTLVMTLRKYLAGHRLGAAHTDWLNRRLYFFVPQAPGRELANAPPLWLCLDLLNGPSLQSTPPKIEAVRWPEASLLAPDHREAINSQAIWKNYQVLTPPLRRTLLELDGPEALALLADLEYEAEKNTGSLYQYDFNGAPHLLSAWPLPPKLAKDMQEQPLLHSTAAESLSTPTAKTAHALSGRPASGFSSQGALDSNSAAAERQPVPTAKTTHALSGRGTAAARSIDADLHWKESEQAAGPDLSPMLTVGPKSQPGTPSAAAKWNHSAAAKQGQPTSGLSSESTSDTNSTAAKRQPMPDQEVRLDAATAVAQPEDFSFLEAARQVYEPRILASLGLHLQKDQLREEEHSRRRLNKTLQKLEQEEIRLKGLAAVRERAVLLQAVLWKYRQDEKLAAISIAAEESPSGREELVELDGKLTLRENMARMFKQSERGARGLEFLAERRKNIAQELQNLADGLGLPQGAKNWPNGLGLPPAAQSGADPQGAKSRTADLSPLAVAQSKAKSNLSLPAAGSRAKGTSARPSGKAEKELAQVQRFTSSDGFIILRGKSAKGNQALLKLAQPHDLWLHVEGGPSAHVVIRRNNLGQEIPERTLLEAGILSGLKSWRKHDERAEIISALVKDVRPLKGGSPGAVLVDKQQKSFVVTLDHELEEKLLS